MSAKPIHVVTLAEIVPRHETDAIATLRQLAALTRQEEGCIRYDLYRDSANPMRVNTLELWSSEEDLKRHLASPYLKKAVIALIGKLSGIPQYRVLMPLDEL
ncbi:putative quinol monooxygenase [Niveibacterium terrae]|uniref:putative quinol monooxygenase n=1 Tax=Niveibacterium terrae TaxID=3373598 RepID=UPI003A911767